MKKIFMVVALSLFIYGCTNNPSTNKHPTKEEWLEVYLTHEIKQSIEMYRRRAAVVISIRTKEREIIITLTSASGQVEGLKEISQSAKNDYVHEVEDIVKGILKEYDWAKNYKLTVLYI